MAEDYDPFDPRSYVSVNARRAAEAAERDLFAEVEPAPAPGSTPVGMLTRALRSLPDHPFRSVDGASTCVAWVGTLEGGGHCGRPPGEHPT